MQRVVIVGASHAGSQLAASLRQEGWEGDIVLLGDEPALPYQRPPLSKAYLAGNVTLEELALRSGSFYVKNDVQLVCDSAVSIDIDGRQVHTEAGNSLEWDQLALCTGARPRRLSIPGADLDNVLYLRNAADVAQIREAARDAHRVVIVGAGYIGLETAASLRASGGLEVTVLESAGRALERVTAPEVSAFFERIHRGHGVDVRTGAQVMALVGDDRVRAVHLADGESIPADLVIVGVGVVPNVDLAADAGLAVDDGVVIDHHARTSAPAVFAAGDCATHDMPRYGRRVRLECVPSAVEQAKVAASSMCGKSNSISALPWFWSDQYDLKLQIAGLNTGYDEVLVDGDPTLDNSFSCFYLRDGQLIAADCVNRSSDFMFSKRALASETPVEKSDLMSRCAR